MSQNSEFAYDRINDYAAIKISLAKPNDIRSWSYGEVKKPETINYRTYRPERDGLFCEKIFGPEKDWECACGKYRGMKYKGMTCDRCGVKITHSRVRRKRMGHIDLAAPVVHIWFFKAASSRLATLLGMKASSLEKVIYFQDYVVIDPGETPLKMRQLLSEEEYRGAKEEHPDGKFIAEMGAEAIRKLLARLDLVELSDTLRQDLAETKSKQRKKELINQLKLVESLRDSDNKPEWMVLDTIPVIPPDLRPLVLLESGTFATSDLNDLYRRIINRNNRLKKLVDLNAPEVIIRNEKRMLQQSVDALFDNGRCKRPVLGSSNRPLKSLTDMIKGKQGRFRENLLGKRVDYSARSVIVVGPNLRLHQCGLPKKIALELYQPFIIRRLKELQHADTIKSAKKMLERKDEEVWDILEEVIQNHPVLLNRAPTLHRMGIQAFEPVLVEGNAIRLHPLVCRGFNADFDGDQMAVHLPLSLEAQVEAHTLMLATNNIFSPANGSPIISPSQDVVMGCYFSTMSLPGMRGEGMKFSSKEELLFAFQHGKVHLHAKVWVRMPKERWLKTSDMNISAYREHLNYIWPADGTSLEKDKSDDSKKSENKAVEHMTIEELIKAFYAHLDPESEKALNEKMKAVRKERMKALKEKMKALSPDDSFEDDSFDNDSFEDEKLQNVWQLYHELKNYEWDKDARKWKLKKGPRVEWPVLPKYIPERYEDEKMPVWEGMLFQTTPGRMLFNDILPEKMPYYNEPLKSRSLAKVISDCHERIGRRATIDLLDDLMRLGFQESTRSGLSFATDDLITPKEKHEIIEAAEKKVANLSKLYMNGVITADERYNGVLDAWTHAREDITENMMKELEKDRHIQKSEYDGIVKIYNITCVGESEESEQAETETGEKSEKSKSGEKGKSLKTAAGKEKTTEEEKKVVASSLKGYISIQNSKGQELQRFDNINAGDVLFVKEKDKVEKGKRIYEPIWYVNPIFLMANSGARGGVEQIRQLSGMRGLMAKPSGQIIETPIKANFREGLSVLEYFSSTHGARKGLADTALKTADSGYLTRKLADVAQNVVVTQNDCGTAQGITKETIYRGEKVEVSLADSIRGRVSRVNIVDPRTDEIIVKAGGLITNEVAEKIKDLGLEKIQIRSPLTCKAELGVCALCYGMDLSTGRLVEEGMAVGTIAAQSIGEPGTQLTMRTFHIGGVAARDVEEREIRSKQSGTAKYVQLEVIENEKGECISLSRSGSVVILDSLGREWDKYDIPIGATLLVKDNGAIKKDQSICEWDPHSVPILAKCDGIVHYVDIIEGDTVRFEEDPNTGNMRRTVADLKGDRHPQIDLKSPKGNETLDFYYLPGKALIEVEDGEKVSRGKLLAKTSRDVSGTQDITGGLPRVTEIFEARKPKDPAVLAEIDGKVKLGEKRHGKRTIIVQNEETGIERIHEVPHGKHMRVHADDLVKAGDAITDGPLVPHDILRISGEDDVRKYLIREIQNVYRSQRVQINDKHIEIIASQMLRKVRIENAGDTPLLEGTQIDKIYFERENNKLKECVKVVDPGDTHLRIDDIYPRDVYDSINEEYMAQGKKGASVTKPQRAEASTQLLGITKAAVQSSSFISAASFQETTKVLTEAALASKTDHLIGLKENVILGHLIPAGTGFKTYQLAQWGDKIDMAAAAAQEAPVQERSFTLLNEKDSTAQPTAFPMGENIFYQASPEDNNKSDFEGPNFDDI